MLNLSVHNDRMSRHTWGWTLSLAQTIEGALANTTPPSAREELAALDDPLTTLRELFDRFTAEAAVARNRAFVEQAHRDLARAEDQVRRIIRSLGRTISARGLGPRKDDALATLAHELNSPLAVISCCSRRRRRRPSSGGPRRHDGPAAKAGDAVSRVIKDVADMARLKRGGMTIEIEPVDLNQVVRAAIEARCRGRSEGPKSRTRICASLLWS